MSPGTGAPRGTTEILGAPVSGLRKETQSSQTDFGRVCPFQAAVRIGVPKASTRAVLALVRRAARALCPLARGGAHEVGLPPARAARRSGRSRRRHEKRK